MVLGNPHFCFGAGHEQEFSQSSDDQPADAGCAHDDIVPLKYIEYGIIQRAIPESGSTWQYRKAGDW